MAYETLTNTDKFLYRPDRELFDEPTKDCPLIDERYDANCKNWADTLKEDHSSDMQWSSLLANDRNGRESTVRYLV